MSTTATGYRRRRDFTQAVASRRPGRLNWLELLSIDGLFALVSFLALLFVIKLGTLSGIVFLASVLAYGAFRWRRALECWPAMALALVFPAYATLSTLWSYMPGQSLKYGLELIVTVAAGVMLAAAPDRWAVLRGMFIAFTSYVVAALAFGHYVGVGNTSHVALAGLSDGKNLLGDIASTGALISLATVLVALSQRKWLWILAAVAALLLELYVMAAARSAGAMIAVSMGLATLLGLALIQSGGVAVRATATFVVGAVGLASALSYRWLAQTLIELSASLFDKDPTLTGRTYLWYRAEDLIAQHPVLGRGFYAFWVQGNIEAEGLWRYAGIGARMGFNFHNTPIELLLHLGWAGLVIYAAVAVIGIGALVYAFVVRPSLYLCFWAGLLAYEFVRMPVESLGHGPFYFSTVLIFAGLTFALLPERRRLARNQAPEVTVYAVSEEPLRS